MGKTVFIPLTDDLLYEHPERILGPVIPFSQQGRSRVRTVQFGDTQSRHQHEVRNRGCKLGESLKVG